LQKQNAPNSKGLRSLFLLEETQTGTILFFHLLNRKDPAAKISDFGKFLLDFLAAVPVTRRERLEPLFRPILEGDIPDLTLEWRRSQREDAQSFPEALLDDPSHQDTLPKGFQQIG
jgi:hypothetical protein